MNNGFFVRPAKNQLIYVSDSTHCEGLGRQVVHFHIVESGKEFIVSYDFIEVVWVWWGERANPTRTVPAGHVGIDSMPLRHFWTRSAAVEFLDQIEHNGKVP